MSTEVNEVELVNTGSTQTTDTTIESTDDFMARINAIEQGADEVHQEAIAKDTTASDEDVDARAAQIFEQNKATNNPTEENNSDETKENNDTIPLDSNETETIKDDSSENIQDEQIPQEQSILKLAERYGVRSEEDLAALKRSHILNKQNPLTVEEAKFVKENNLLDSENIAVLKALRSDNPEDAIALIKMISDKNKLNLNELNFDEAKDLDTDIELPDSDKASSDNYHAFLGEVREARSDKYLLDNFFDKMDNQEFERVLADPVLSNGFKNHIANGTLEIVNERVKLLEQNDSIAGKFKGMSYTDKYLAASLQLREEEKQQIANQVNQNSNEQSVQNVEVTQQQQLQQVTQQHVEQQAPMVNDEQIANHLNAMNTESSGDINVEAQWETSIQNPEYRAKKATSEEFMSFIAQIEDSI